MAQPMVANLVLVRSLFFLRQSLGLGIESDWRREGDVETPFLSDKFPFTVGVEPAGDLFLVVCARFPGDECGRRYVVRERRMKSS